MVLAAIGQICSTNSATHNLAQCQKVVKKAAEAGAKALFLPEASDYIGSSPSESLSLVVPITDSVFVHGLRFLAIQHKIAIQVGLHEPSPFESTTSPSRILNTLVWISETGTVLTDTRYTKLHLFNLDLSSSNGPVMLESTTTAPGTTITEPFSSPVGLVGSQICFDLRFPEPALRLRRLGATVITYPSAFTVPTGQMGHWEVLLRARAIENQCYVVAAAQCGRHNSSGKNGGRVSYGDSMVVDPEGKILGRASRVENSDEEVVEGREPEVVVFEIEEEVVARARARIPLERRTDVYPEI